MEASTGSSSQVPRQSGGILDHTRGPAPAPEAPQGPTAKAKEQFPDVFTEQKRMVEHTETVARGMERRNDPGIAEAAKTQAALSSADLISPEEEKISPIDMKLAEQLIFKGYAETDVTMANFPDIKYTLCSTSAQELSIIDEIAFDMVKSVKQNNDGTVDMPENHIRTMRNALFVALSYRGMNGKELTNEPTMYLNTLKRAIIKMNDMMDIGDLKEAIELNKSIKEALIKRATLVKKMATPLIDYLSGEKYRFDAKMSMIMDMKGIIPKS